MRFKTPVFICGATALGIAAAVRLGDRAVLAEENGWAAGEFAAAFEPGEGPWEPVTAEGKALADELVRRAVLSSRGTHIQGAAPVFFRLLRDPGAWARFLTRLAGIRRQGDGYVVTLADSEGFHTLEAGTILDTTSTGETAPGRFSGFRESLNATLVPGAEGAEPPVSSDPGLTVIPGSFFDEFYLRCRLEPGTSLEAARETLFLRWGSRGPGLEAWRIAAISPMVSRRAAPGVRRVEDNWFWAPSAACRNLLDAFETGLGLSLPALEEGGEG